MGLGSRQTVKRVYTTLAVLRLVLRSRLHRIMTVKSFAVLLTAGQCAHDFSARASAFSAVALRHPRPFANAQGMTTAIRSYVFASLAIRALIAYMILLLAYLPGW